MSLRKLILERRMMLCMGSCFTNCWLFPLGRKQGAEKFPSVFVALFWFQLSIKWLCGRKCHFSEVADLARRNSVSFKAVYFFVSDWDWDFANFTFSKENPWENCWYHNPLQAIFPLQEFFQVYKPPYFQHTSNFQVRWFLHLLKIALIAAEQ